MGHGFTWIGHTPQTSHTPHTPPLHSLHIDLTCDILPSSSTRSILHEEHRPRRDVTGEDEE